ncbi:MAG: ABC transporter permease [Rikenellaceae bacterium]|nr:ABC transporter permease [Rikenellaceae bacterium]
MNELFHVIQREYVTRVCTKSFVLITLLTPLFLALLFVLPIYLTTKHENYAQMKIGLVDSGGAFEKAFDDSELSVEWLGDIPQEDAQNLVLNHKWEGIVYVVKADSVETLVQYYSTKQPSLFLLNQIKTSVQKLVVNEKLAVYGIHNVEDLTRFAKESVSVENIKVGKTKTASSPYERPLSMLFGLIIYTFVLLFSSQVMRGVTEEKSSRIVELIITSISSVRFMAGKIIGIALLGLTQIICWIVILYDFTMVLSHFTEFSSSGSMNMLSQRMNPEDVNQILKNLSHIEFNVIIPAFIFFFLGGYLLYASVFAAIAATSNDHHDTQQLTVIVTLPLILSVVVLSNTVSTPDSSLSYWFSIIPFTSPVIMMGRIIHGAPVQDILLSMFF